MGQQHHNQHLPQYNNVHIKHETDMHCRKCSTQFSDEGLLRGHEEVCQGPLTDVNTQGIMYAKGMLSLLCNIYILNFEHIAMQVKYL